jgi:hypothetical protein
MMKDDPNKNKLDRSPANPDSEPVDDRTRKARRRLVQVLAAGSVITTAKMMPREWTKPVVESAMIPAHAQTTGPDEPTIIVLGNSGNFVADLTGTGSPESLLASSIERAWNEVVDVLVPEAYAQDDGSSCRLSGCAHIRYVQGQKLGSLTVGTAEEPSIGEALPEGTLPEFGQEVVPFTDGVPGTFGGGCLGGTDFLVDLINDNLSRLTLTPPSQTNQDQIIIDLVRSFVCEPAGDRPEDDFEDDLVQEGDETWAPGEVIVEQDGEGEFWDSEQDGEEEH